MEQPIIGTVYKTMQQGQKLYAVLHSILEDGKYKLVTFFAGELIELERQTTQIRLPRFDQQGEVATMLRQMVGIPLQKPPKKAVQLGGKLGTITLTDADLESFEFNGQKLKDLPSPMKEMAKSIFETLGGQVKKIEFKDDTPSGE